MAEDPTSAAAAATPGVAAEATHSVAVEAIHLAAEAATHLAEEVAGTSAVAVVADIPSAEADTLAAVAAAITAKRSSVS